MEENHRAMLVHKGPYYEHWRHRLLAAFGVAPVDEQHEQG